MRWALAALLLAGCAEMRRPPPAEPPVDLSGGATVNRLPAVISLAAADFDRQGAGLQGRPAAAALAAARLEWLAADGSQLAGVAESYRFGLQRGVDELRASLAIRPEATSAEAVASLVAASRDLAAGREPMLGAPVFRDVQPTPLQRLSDPGAQPNAAIATSALREEYARQQEERRTNDRGRFDSPGMGLTTFGLGGTTDR